MGCGGGVRAHLKARHFVYISINTTSLAVKTQLISPASGKRKKKNEMAIFCNQSGTLTLAFYAAMQMEGEGNVLWGAPSLVIRD